MSKFTKGTIHLRCLQILTIFEPYLPTLGSFFTTIHRQIWTIFDPSLPKKCRRLKWMVPKVIDASCEKRAKYFRRVESIEKLTELSRQRS